ncbi:sugar transporter [Chitinophaga agrisoli]|uniref:Sugar transporter n=1 Tax=Chitinophaga agrisoli TaxID=2607653 RepID=A0A5B2VX79_9BACT|nr:protein-disulfide reductase DsbD N-terminal domain-containing protein [Chitinophaga agrisoli]KAA2242609.1 sugar transporter [Chitinophaga agrisoli]
MKSIFAFIGALLLHFTASSQILQPVTWSYAAKKTSATTATVFIKATLQDGWHIYAQEMKGAGPVKTSFTFTPAASFQLKGQVTAPAPLTKYEKAFDTDVNYYEHSVIFQQNIQLTGGKATVKGAVAYMICSNLQCLPPATKEFSIPIN